MKRIEISRLFVFMVVYLFILVIAAVLPISISHFNYVFLVVFTCLSFLLFPYYKTFLQLLFWGPIFILLYLFQPERSFLYCVNDILIILCLLHFVYVSQKTYIAFDELKFLRTCLWLYIGMTMIFSFFPSFYNDEGRFLGLMKGVNLSASVSMMLLILIWEIQKKIHESWLILILLFIILLYCCYVYKTRTLFLVLPYFLYQFRAFFRMRHILAIISVISVIAVINYWEQLVDLLRLTNDSSYITRMSLYLYMFDLLKDSYFVVPHGFNAATSLVVKYTGVDNYSVHNDLLRYLFDWGILFLLFLVILFKKILCHQKMNFYLIFLSVFALSFHNMLFSIYIWCPFLLIMNINRMSINHRL